MTDAVGDSVGGWEADGDGVDGTSVVGVLVGVLVGSGGVVTGAAETGEGVVSAGVGRSVGE